MLTFSISPYQHKRKDKPKFIHGTQEHKDFILHRAINTATESEKFEPGDCYFVHGCKEKGMILAYVFDPKVVEWEGLKPKFLELYFKDENLTRLYHPSDLRKR